MFKVVSPSATKVCIFISNTFIFPIVESADTSKSSVILVFPNVVVVAIRLFAVIVPSQFKSWIVIDTTSRFPSVASPDEFILSHLIFPSVDDDSAIKYRLFICVSAQIFPIVKFESNATIFCANCNFAAVIEFEKEKWSSSILKPIKSVSK